MRTVNVKSLGECPYLISLQPEEMIGKGSYAQVYRAYNKNEPKEKLAAKIFDLIEAKKFESAFKQLSVISTLPKHANLVNCKKIKITSKSRLYIIMQLCEQNLQQHLSKKGVKFTQQKIWQFIFQICQGYKILKAKSIVHRDIKPANILIGFDGKYKLSDFGLAQITNTIGDHRKDVKTKGSLLFIAPELLKPQHTHQISALTDVYSLGVTLYYLCYQRYPYFYQKKTFTYKQKQKRMSIRDFINEIENNKPVFPKSSPYSQQLNGLIKSMLEKEPDSRCTWEYISHALLQNQHILKYIENQKRELVNMQHSDNISQNTHKFRIVEISDAFLKNLSLLDADLYQSISCKSLVVIDHIQAEIISRRQAVYFCDRLYYRLELITCKIQSQQQKSVTQQFIQYLLLLNVSNSEKLAADFQLYYKQIDTNQLLKCIASRKYNGLFGLIQQDRQFLRKLVLDKMCPSQYSDKKKTSNIKIKVYELCSSMIQILYRNQYYEECKKIDQIEKWVSGGKQETIFNKIRKNQNALKQFDQLVMNLNNQNLKSIISNHYLQIFKLIDQEAKKNWK